MLAPVGRRDILLGKNLAIAPFALGVGCLALVVLQVLQPMGSLHFLATLVQMLIAFLLCCLMGNVVSILAPSAVSVGSLKPAKAKISTVLIHILVTLLSPVVLLPGVVLFGSELLARSGGSGLAWMPLYLVLSLFECAVVAVDLPALAGIPRQVAAES